MPKEVYITIELKRRGFIERLLRFPFAVHSHYKILRKYNGILESLYGSYLLAGILIKVKP